MKMANIISTEESRQILRNDQRRVVLEKRGAELREASAEKRKTILAEIECDIEKEMRRREPTFCRGAYVIY